MNGVGKIIKKNVEFPVYTDDIGLINLNDPIINFTSLD